MRAWAQCDTMSDMKALDQRGGLNGLLIPFILSILFFVGAASFGAWAFMSRQDYKNNTDAKIATAQAVTKAQTQAADQVIYAQAAKYPLRSYIGPSAYGNVKISYPKTWSAYVQDATNGGSSPVNGYFQPDVVPNVNSDSSTFALRVQVLSNSYPQQLASFANQAKNGKVTVAPYSLPKLPNVIGSIVTGQIGQNVQGTMIIVPIRSLTLEIWTEQPSEQSDFTNIILPNVTFSP